MNCPRCQTELIKLTETEEQDEYDPFPRFTSDYYCTLCKSSITEIIHNDIYYIDWRDFG